MHEQSIVESLLRLVLDRARKADARKIISIHLVVGDYTGIEEDAVNFYFGFLSKDTIAAGAGIHYTQVPAQLRCPECHGKRVEIVGGRELYIENMKVE